MSQLLAVAICCVLATGCSYKNRETVTPVTTHAIRLKPGEDLRKSIADFVKKHNIRAGWIVTCAGSVTQYNIRFANQQEGSSAKGHFEIVSLTGTLSVNGSHLHIAVSDSTGKTIGGHLLDGNVIYTTAEIVLQQSNELLFTREKDGTTPWEELQVKLRSSQSTDALSGPDSAAPGGMK